jgi:hypothetical protein
MVDGIFVTGSEGNPYQRPSWQGSDIISSRLSSSKVVAPQGTVQITVKSSAFASAFSNTLAFLVGTS